MKKGFKLSAALLSGLMVLGAATGCSCGKDDITAEEGRAWAEENGYVKTGYAEGLPSSVRTDLATCDGAASKIAYSTQCSGILANNLKDYLGREDIEYIDVRNAGTGDSLNNYAAGHLKGFKLVEFFNYVYPQGGGAGTNQLFYQQGTKEDGTPIFAPRYADSVAILEELFPKDKTLFIMCAAGGRVTTVMQLLDQYGWNMEHIYNVGGWGAPTNYGTSAEYKDYRVTTNVTLTPYTGTATGKTQGTTGEDLSAEVKVLLDGKTYKIAAVYLTGGTIASTSYKETVEAQLDDFFGSLVGLTVEQVRERVVEGSLADDVDLVAGATHTTTLLYGAVIDALKTVVVE